MAGGEYFVVHRMDIDPNSVAQPTDRFGELETHVYDVADDEGPIAEVVVDVEGKFQGAEIFSVLRLRTLGASAIGGVIERAVSPPLYSEPERQAAVLELLNLVSQLRGSGPEQLLRGTSHPQELTV